LRLRLTLSIVEGDEVYQTERTLAQWEESEGTPQTWAPLHGGDPVSDAELPGEVMSEAVAARAFARPE
jgi:hypothetical protein